MGGKALDNYITITDNESQNDSGTTKYKVTISKRFVAVRSNHGPLEDTRADAVLKHMTKSSDVSNVKYFLGMYVPVGTDQITVAPGITARIENLKEERDELQTLNIVLESQSQTVKAIRAFVEECNNTYAQEQQNKLADKLFVFENVPWQNSSKGKGVYSSGVNAPSPPYLLFNKSPFITNRTLSNVFFEQKDLLEKRLNFFQNNKEWYDRKGYPYMLGLLFHGVPGCGKTSTLKAIANMTQRHIISVSLDDIKTNKQLRALFQDEQVHVANSEGMGGHDTFRIPINKRLYVLEVSVGAQLTLTSCVVLVLTCVGYACRTWTQPLTWPWTEPGRSLRNPSSNMYLWCPTFTLFTRLAMAMAKCKTSLRTGCNSYRQSSCPLAPPTLSPMTRRTMTGPWTWPPS